MQQLRAKVKYSTKLVRDLLKTGKTATGEWDDGGKEYFFSVHGFLRHATFQMALKDRGRLWFLTEG